MLLTATLDHYVTTEHVDLRSGYTESSGWSLTVDEQLQGEIDLENALLYVGTNAQANRPDDSAWAFTGVAASQPFYFGGQIQEDGHLYLGASAYDVPEDLISPSDPAIESKGRSSGLQKWGKFSLIDVEHTNPDGTSGTGVFSAWSSSPFGDPIVLMSTYNDGVSNPDAEGLDTTDGITGDDAWWLVNGGHAHFNFGFSAPGRYEVQLQLSADFTSGGIISSDIFTVYFSVGSVGQVEFDASSYEVAEDSGSATINVRRVGGSDGRITVDYATSNGTATDGDDYTSMSGTLTFADGETMKQITIPVLTDIEAEGDETVLLSLTAPGPETIANFMDIYEAGMLGTLDTTTLTITDVSPSNTPSISNIADRFVVEGSSTGAIPFTVGDGETAAGELVVSATSSNQIVLPDANIILGGSGANRTISLASVFGQTGPVTITVTVTDADGLQASDTFVLTVGGLVRATFDRSAGIVNASRPLDVRLADVDGDSDLDVLYSTHITSISILRNNGDGTFGAPTELLAITVSDVRVADLNGDNLPDIVSSVYLDNTFAETAIAVWHNLGSGNFAAQEIIESTRSTSFVGLTGVDDVDGDGRNDLVLNLDGASYVRNLGNGAFGPMTGIVTGGVTWSAALQDVDQDGDLDVVRAFSDNGVFRLQLLRNSGASTPVFAAEELASFGGNSLSNIAIADTNQDGFADIHLSRRAPLGREIIALHGTSTGAFLAPVVLGSWSGFTDLKIGDIDGDGRPDLALAARDQNQVLFAQNLGSGVFTELQEFTSDGVYLNPGQEDVEIGDIDGDGRNDLVYMERFAERIAWSRNRQEENVTALTPPESRTYLNGYPMTFDVFLGFNALLDTSGGSPTLPVTIGSQTTQVPYVGQPNANTLRFRHQVQNTDVDTDGIQVANSIVLNGATITDVHGRLLDPAFLQFADVDTTGILVNGGAPYVTGNMRLDATPAAANSVRYAVTFSEPVTGVTIDDFALDMNGPAGAAITSVTGSGDSYVVTADIGSGDGTLKLRVLDDDSIVDANSHPLGGVGVGSGEFAYGQGYTIRSSTATPVFNNVITDGHLDVSLLLYEGTWYPYWNGVGFWDTTDTVISAGPDARETRPTDSKWDFLGAEAGEPVWIFPETFSTTTPWPGVGAYDNQPGTFASYFESDLRVNATAPWLKMQLLDVRGPEGGEFSLYQSGITDPIVFMASANGIGVEDTAWIPNLDHIHYNWAFTKPGLYQVDVISSGYIDLNQTGTYEPGVDPLSESQIITLHFAVELSAQDDAFKVTSGETLRGSVTLNDQSEWGIAASTTTVESTTSHGTLVLQPNGAFTYQPSATFNGSDSFTYRLENPNGGFTTATVNITGSTRPDFDAVLRAGHTDIGVNFEDGAWDLHIHDEETDTEYEPDEVLLYVGRDAMLTRSDDAANAAYDFLGAPVGSTLFVLPQVENPNLPFLGIGGEELADGVLQGNVATLRLASVSGPGEFSIWQSGLTPTTPNLIMATSDGIDASDAFEVAAGSHAHMNFAFTRQGRYEVTFVASGIDADGNATDSGQVTYYFYVTDGLVPFTMPNVLSPGLSTSGFNSELADFNGDGILDLIVAGSGGNALGYRQGVVDGSFLPEQGLNAGTGLSAEAIVAVDYDLDGDQDLVALEFVQSVANTGAITLYRNDGSATFTRGVLRSDLPVSFELGAGDLNGDGRPDVVYGKAGTTVAYALQQSNGELGTEIALPATLTSMSGLLLGDMNNDGDLDIVVANRENSPNAYFSVFSNDGNGVFGTPQNTTTGRFPNAHQLVDMNGDGRLDVVTGESVAGSRAGYYPQLADGTFGSRVIILPTNTQLNEIRVADINGDGVPDIVAGAIVGSFSLVWSPGLGGGAFGNTIRIDPGHGNLWSLQVGDVDGDGYPDIITTGTATATRPSAVKVYVNKTGENPMVLLTPAARTRVAGDPIDLEIYFGFPIMVTGSSRVALQLGANTVYANYLSGSGTSTLGFRYLVTNTDVDLDGVQLASNVIDLNGGTLTDPLGGAAVLEFPNELFVDVNVNGVGPLVSGITRLDPRSTDATSVRFKVQFNKDVTGVDASDFALVMNAGDLSGASIVSITGSGSLYEVTVSTGNGTGTLGLNVKSDASVFESGGNPLAIGFAGGEVYTVRKAPLGELDIYYTDGHADYRPIFENGEFSYVVHGDPGVLPEIEHNSDEVYTYADSNAIVNRAASDNYNFLGVAAGQPLYVLPDTQKVNLPFLGLSGESLVAGQFAAYRPTEDPRITSATIREYVKVQMVGMRFTGVDGSNSGGEFSLFSGTTPTVWMASSDGITENDSFWLYRTHFHRNLAFSKPGVYEIDVFMSGYLDTNANGIKDPNDIYTESGIKTMVFNVDTLGARDDDFTVIEGNTLSGDVALNDEWAEGLGEFTASLVTPPSNGTLTLQADGTFTYQPWAGFAGNDSFEYRLTNPRGGFTTATASITVAALPEFIAGLTKDHADLGIAFEDGAWNLHVHVEGEAHEHEEGHEHEEEHEHGGLEYRPDEILIQLGPSSATPAPESPEFAFLGVPGGAAIYVLPSVQNPALPFLGIATEEIPEGTFVGNEVSLRLKSVNGPGFYSLWSTDSFGVPTPHLTSSNGIDDDDVLLLGTGTHIHFDMAFTAAGVYAITFEAIGIVPDDADGTVVSSGDVTYYFSVNLGLAPTVTTTETELTYPEQSAPRIVDPNPTLTDTDSTNFDGGQLRADIPVHAHPADELMILHQGTGRNQIGVSGNMITLGVAGGNTVTLGTFTGGTNGEPLVISLTPAATPSTTRLLMRRIAFRNLSDDPGSEERTVRFVVADGDGEISDAALRVISVSPVNDAPVVVTGEGTVQYIENTAPVVIDSNVTITDPDSPDFDLGRLTVTITANRQTADRLTILAEGDAEGEINVSGNAVLYGGVPIGTFTGGFTTSNPLIVSLNTNATSDAVQQLARRVAFHNAGTNATELTRTVNFQVNDGDGNSSAAAVTLVEVTTVNDNPVITNSGPSLNYREDGTPVLIAGGATVVDPDSPDFNGGALTVSFIAGSTGADQLGIRNQGAGNGRINLDGVNVTYGVGGVAVIIGSVSGGQNGSELVISLNENASAIATRTLMRNLTFSIAGNTPNSSRTVRLALTDGSGGISNHADRIIEVTGVNDAPVVTTSAGANNYAAGSGAIVIDDSITVEDIDSPDLAGGFLLISLSTNKQTTDRLTIIAEGDGEEQINVVGFSVLYEGIVIGTYTGGFTSNAPLRILFNSNATPASAQKLARRIGFFNTSNSPSLLTRSIVFSINDGDGKNSLNAIKQMNVAL